MYCILVEVESKAQREFPKHKIVELWENRTQTLAKPLLCAGENEDDAVELAKNFMKENYPRVKFKRILARQAAPSLRKRELEERAQRWKKPDFAYEKKMLLSFPVYQRDISRAFRFIFDY